MPCVLQSFSDLRMLLYNIGGIDEETFSLQLEESIESTMESMRSQDSDTLLDINTRLFQLSKKKQPYIPTVLDNKNKVFVETLCEAAKVRVLFFHRQQSGIYEKLSEYSIL